MFRKGCGGGGYNWWVGYCAIAVGLGILVVATFPTGLLMFLVAFLLIVCGGACIRR